MVRIDERLIALQVEDQFGVEQAGNFGDAIGAAGMIAPRVDDVAAEAFHRRRDAGIIRGHEDVVGALCLAGALVDVLNEIFACLP
jgi:hypothetical protein